MMPEGLPRQRVKNPLGAQATGPCSKLPQSAAGTLRSRSRDEQNARAPQILRLPCNRARRSRPESPMPATISAATGKEIAGVRLLMNQAESLIRTFSQWEKIKVRTVLDLMLVSYRGDGVGEVSPFFPLPLPWPPCCPPCWPYCPPCGGPWD